MKNMKVKPILRTLAIVAILITNVGCDQISKNVVRKRIHYNEEISLMNNYLTLTKIENSGAFFSIGNSLPQPIKLLLLTILPMVSLGVAFVYLLTKRSLTNTTITGICFIIGGGAGNIYDRLVYGSVTDFLHINFVIFQTAIFNMADVSIMTGIFAIAFDAFRSRLNYRMIDGHDND
jgi:signal peptidase II